MKVKVTITLDEANWQRLRFRALEEKTSASGIIDNLITEYLPKKKAPMFVVGGALPTRRKVGQKGGKR